MTSRFRWQLPACLRHARSILFCLGIALLAASAANGGTLGISSYESWQWGGFSRSVPTISEVSRSVLSRRSSLLLTSAYSDVSLASASTVNALDALLTTDGASLSGVVYYDENASATRDTTDWGIRDAIVIATAQSSNVSVTTTTASDGSYVFKGLAPDDYTITLYTPSTQPELPSLGTITDANGDLITTGLGSLSGNNKIISIHLAVGDTAVDYDFPQLVYPKNLISKRMLINTDPGLHHTVTPVPEPSSLVLLAVAGLMIGGLSRCRRSSIERLLG